MLTKKEVKETPREKSRLFGMSAWILIPKSNDGERMAICNQKWCKPDFSNNLFLQLTINQSQSRTGLKENRVPHGNFPCAEAINRVYIHKSLPFVTTVMNQSTDYVQRESNNIEWSKKRISCGYRRSRKSALPFCSNTQSSTHTHVFLNSEKTLCTSNLQLPVKVEHLAWNTHKRTPNM